MGAETGRSTMPPRKHGTDHRHGGGGKHVSSLEEVKARNEGRETDYDRQRREREEARTGGAGGSNRPAKPDEKEEEEQEIADEPAPEKKDEKKKGVTSLIETANPNAVKVNEDKQGVEMTRKKREELEKARARRA